MVISKQYLTINKYSRPHEIMGKIEDIVVHYVGNPGTTAMQNRNYFENLRITHKTYASSQFIIGLDGEVLQLMDENEVAFHAGNRTENRKSIGIECCHPDDSGKFTDATYNSLLDLCVYLCEKYNIPVSHIKRHFDITGKCCPKYFVEHEAEWQGFKNQVAERLGRKEEEKKEEELEMAKTYSNGSTVEICYKDSDFKTKTGSLDKWEKAECLGIVTNSKGQNAYIVKYKINKTNSYAVGFCKYNGGIK